MLKEKTSRAKSISVDALSIIYVLQGSLKVKRHLGTCIVVAQVLFGILFVAYLPTLDPYPGCTPIEDAYDGLPRRDMICPERSANILSRIMFSWLNPLMDTFLGMQRLRFLHCQT